MILEKKRVNLAMNTIHFLELFGAVFACGALGGMANSMISENGLTLPHREDKDGANILVLGWIGNVVLGGIAAGVSWALYGSQAGVQIVASAAADPSKDQWLSPANLAAAVLVGIGGARWLTSEVDKNLLKAAAAKAAAAAPDHGAAASIAAASPLQALNIANTLAK